MIDTTDTLHTDLRRLLDAVETLLARADAPLATPLEQMLIDLAAIRRDLVACAATMRDAADAVRTLAEREDPVAEIRALRTELAGEG